MMYLNVTHKAENVRNGDFLTDLDNGYVVDVESEPNVSLSSCRYAHGTGEGMVLITFHDAQGEENYLILRSDHPIEIER